MYQLWTSFWQGITSTCLFRRIVSPQALKKNLVKSLLLNPLTFPTDPASSNYIACFPVHCHLTHLISTAENVAVFQRTATGFLSKSSTIYVESLANLDPTSSSTMKQCFDIIWSMNDKYKCVEQYLHHCAAIRIYFPREELQVLVCKQELISTLYQKCH